MEASRPSVPEPTSDRPSGSVSGESFGTSESCLAELFRFIAGAIGTTSRALFMVPTVIFLCPQRELTRIDSLAGGWCGHSQDSAECLGLHMSSYSGSANAAVGCQVWTSVFSPLGWAVALWRGCQTVPGFFAQSHIELFYKYLGCVVPLISAEKSHRFVLFRQGRFAQAVLVLGGSRRKQEIR